MSNELIAMLFGNCKLFGDIYAYVSKILSRFRQTVSYEHLIYEEAF